MIRLNNKNIIQYTYDNGFFFAELNNSIFLLILLQMSFMRFAKVIFMRSKVVIVLFRHRMKLNYSVLQKQNWIYLVFGLNLFCVFWCIVLRVYRRPYYVFPCILIENERPIILSLKNRVFWVNLKFTDRRRVVLKDSVEFKSSKPSARNSILKSNVADVNIKGFLHTEANIRFCVRPWSVTEKNRNLHGCITVIRPVDVVFKGLSIWRAV